MLPHSQSEGVSALDGIDDDEGESHAVTADDAEELFGDAPATTATPVADKPFEV